MVSKTLLCTLAGTCLAMTALPSFGQVPTLLNGNLETPSPNAAFTGQGFRKYNYARWRTAGDGMIPTAVFVHGGTHSAMIPGSEGRPAREFEGYETEDPLDTNAFTPVYDWPEFTFNPPTGQPITTSFWFLINPPPATETDYKDGPIVVSKFGLKISIQRNDPGDFSAFQTWEFFDIDPAAATAPPGTFLTTRTGPFGPNGETLTLPAIHTNGQWVKFTKTISQATDICTDFGGTCPTPPTNPAYVKIMAERFDFPLVVPCGGDGQPTCTRNRSYGTAWVDDFTFTQGPVCIADFNGSGSVTVQDLFDFLAAWFNHCQGAAGSPCNGRSADVNNSGTVTVQDLFDFLSHWFARC